MMFEIRIHRFKGHDESFEAESLTEALALAGAEIRDRDARLVEVLDDSGRVIDVVVTKGER
jgi:hypothetical protein